MGLRGGGGGGRETRYIAPTQKEIESGKLGGGGEAGRSDLTMWMSDHGETANKWRPSCGNAPPTGRQMQRTDGTHTNRGPLYLERLPSCRRPWDSSSTLGSLQRGGGEGGELEFRECR